MDLEARRGGAAAKVQRLDKSCFSVAAGQGEIELRYRVHASDPSVRKAWLDSERGFFNGSSLFYCPIVDGPLEFRLRLESPPASLADWQVATSLQVESVAPNGFGVYSADSYEELIDHPVELGRFVRHEFEIDQIPHALVLSGRVDADAERIVQDLTKICRTQRQMFGGEPRLDQYLFLTNVVGAGYGGLEHRSSCALICSRADLPIQGQKSQSTEYRNFLGLCSHEYFHQWNVKRITPRRFSESTLDTEAYSQDLWHYEGVTSYYDDLFLLRSGCVEPGTYLDMLAGQITRVERAPAHRRQTLAEASFETWIKFYQPDDNTLNAAANYYAKGALVALCLDLELRLKSEMSLDAVMQALWKRHGREGVPVEESGLERIAAEISGLDLTEFFDRALRSTDPLPLETLLTAFGVGVARRASTSPIDPGGRSVVPAPGVWSGNRFRPGSLVISHVLDDGPMQRAGVIAGDELVALNGQKLTPQHWLKLMETLRPGACELHFFRDDSLHVRHVELVAPPLDTWVLTLADCDGEVADRRKAWLGA